MERIASIPTALALVVLAAGTTGAAVSVYLPPEELTARAPIVVEATVLEARSGLDPAGGTLHTYVTLRVDHVHRGPSDLDTLVIREPGGRWGDLVHQLDAVPVYRRGERVFTYLEPASDGALRTVGMFFGKFHLDEDAARGALRATRDLEGQGTILGRAGAEEIFTRNDLAALAAGVPYRGTPVRPARAGKARRNEGGKRDWTTRPPEWERLEWDGESSRRGFVTPASRGGERSGIDIAFRPAPPADEQFAPLSLGSPTRWNQSDSGTAVTIHVEPGGNPLNDNAAAIIEIERALDAWTDVPQSRLHLALGNTSFDYTGTYVDSPASSYSGTNVVLFDDPYDDISDPSGCGGVLAIGGYWRSGSVGTPINNVAFHPAVQLYVIFNNNFECFLGNADNLAEVATHEIGHGIGFGHSTVADAIMRSSAYGGRGPRLGDDDIDAMHCHYPHTLSLLSPNGGEAWTGGDLENVTWSVTAEVGADPGTVDLEISSDGGASWSTVISGTPNDGAHPWVIPDTPGTDFRVRVVRHALGTLGSPYPASACSEDASNTSFSIAAATAAAGAVADSLSVTKLGGGLVRVTWGDSCSGEATDYALYEGGLASLRSGTWDHAPVECNAGALKTTDLTPAAGTRYFLASAIAGAAEGTLGAGSSGVERPESAFACATREAPTCTP